MEPGLRRLLAVTGRPGIGKSTLIKSLVQQLRRLGCSVGGVLTPEVRENGIRRGFQLVDAASGASVVLAYVAGQGDLRVGKYYVNRSAGLFGASVLRRSLENSDVIVIDEVGPMELRLGELRDAIVSLLTSRAKPMALSFHYRLSVSDPQVYSLISQGHVIVLNESNRNEYLRRAPELARWLAVETECDKGGPGAALHT